MPIIEMYKNMAKANSKTAKRLLKENRNLTEKDIKYLKNVIREGNSFLKAISDGRNRRTGRLVAGHKQG